MRRGKKIFDFNFGRRKFRGEKKRAIDLHFLLRLFHQFFASQRSSLPLLLWGLLLLLLLLLLSLLRLLSRRARRPRIFLLLVLFKDLIFGQKGYEVCGHVGGSFARDQGKQIVLAKEQTVRFARSRGELVERSFDVSFLDSRFLANRLVLGDRLFVRRSSNVGVRVGEHGQVGRDVGRMWGLGAGLQDGQLFRLDGRNWSRNGCLVLPFRVRLKFVYPDAGVDQGKDNVGRKRLRSTGQLRVSPATLSYFRQNWRKNDGITILGQLNRRFSSKLLKNCRLSSVIGPVPKA